MRAVALVAGLVLFASALASRATADPPNATQRFGALARAAAPAPAAPAASAGAPAPVATPAGADLTAGPVTEPAADGRGGTLAPSERAIEPADDDAEPDDGPATAP